MFCQKCGNEINDNSNFCSKCGFQVGNNQSNYTTPTQTVSGMRTQAEMLAFMQQNGISSIEANKHLPLIVNSLMPNEAVQFVFCGNQNSSGIRSQGIHVYAFTNLRLIVAQDIVSFQHGNLRGVEVYTYNQFGNISYSKNIATGTISIAFFTGTGNIMVNKKTVEFIYNSINQVLFQYGGR